MRQKVVRNVFFKKKLGVQMVIYLLLQSKYEVTDQDLIDLMYLTNTIQSPKE